MGERNYAGSYIREEQNQFALHQNEIEERDEMEEFESAFEISRRQSTKKEIVDHGFDPPGPLDSGRGVQNYGCFSNQQMGVNHMFDIEEDAEDQFDQNNQ